MIYVLFQYFNIEISVTADGINVYDVKEEESKIMQCSFQHWYILEVLDQNKKYVAYNLKLRFFMSLKAVVQNLSTQKCRIHYF